MLTLAAETCESGLVLPVEGVRDKDRAGVHVLSCKSRRYAGIASLWTSCGTLVLERARFLVPPQCGVEFPIGVNVGPLLPSWYFFLYGMGPRPHLGVMVPRRHCSGDILL